MKFKIKKKDTVVVISGKDKGKTGEVMEIIPGDEFKPARVLISKINIVTKHKKPTQTDAGGLVKTEAPLALSKLKRWRLVRVLKAAPRAAEAK